MNGFDLDTFFHYLKVFFDELMEALENLFA